MKTKIIALALCLCVALAAGCGAADVQTEARPEAAVQPEAAAQPAEAAVTEAAAPAYTLTDQPSGTVVFSPDGAVVDGVGVKIASDGDVKITGSGVYTVSGTSQSGRVVVDADETDQVVLVLSGLDLTCREDEVIYFKSAAAGTVVLDAGTENALTSGSAEDAAAAKAAAEEAAEAADGETEEAEEPSGAALRAKCDLTVTGEGSLTVQGYINNGIASTGALQMAGGNVTVYAVNDALKSRADVTVAGGAVSLTAEQDGVQADGDLYILGGDLTVTAGGGADATDMKVSDSSMMGGGPGGGPFGDRDRASQEPEDAEGAEADEAGDASEEPGERTASREPAEQTDEGAESDGTDTGASGEGRMGGFPFPGMGWDAEDDAAGSRKGLKTGGNITVSGGSLTLDCADDAVHAAGDVLITDGVLDIRSADDGVHADGSLTIDGGSVTVSQCYEGLEATAITINDGFVDVTANDDGMNVNGGDFGPPFASGEAAEDEETDGEKVTPELRIRGGLIYVDSGGDGLDSNGNLYIEGGAVFVSGPSTDWDAAIDYGDGMYDYYITGGTVMAGGYSGMLEAPKTGEASQGAIHYKADNYFDGGETVKLLDADGNVILEYAFSHSFNAVVLSSPDIVPGGRYTLVMGDRSFDIDMTDATVFSNSSRGGFPGGGGRRSSGEITEAGDADASAEP